MKMFFILFLFMPRKLELAELILSSDSKHAEINLTQNPSSSPTENVISDKRH